MSCLLIVSENFHLTYQLTDVDRRTGAENTLPNAPVNDLRSTIDSQAALQAGKERTVTGTVDIDVPSAMCKRIRFLCANTSPTWNIFTDPNLDNNWLCIDLQNPPRMSCDTGTSYN